MLGIVLSGGGAKGAYEIGVWKALRKLRIKYDIVTGTSVGALNGVLMVQDDFHKAIKIWENIDYDKIVADGIFDNKMDMIKYYTKNIVKNGGADIKPLENLVSEAVDEESFYKSKINYGLVTYNFSKLEPKIISKKNIKKGELQKYIIASATCYPFFKKKKIGNDNFVDGGLFDNLPINLAISLGATEIIAVDLKAIGIKQKVKSKAVKITYISPNNDIGHILEFEKEKSRKNIKFGYNDTMKKFHKLEGNKFTFKRNELYSNYLKYGDKYFSVLSNIFPNDYNKLKTDDKKIKHFNKVIEDVGIIFELDESKIYRKRVYNKLLIKKFKMIESTAPEEKSLLNKRQVIKNFYYLINTNNKKLSKYDLFLHDEVLMAIYLYVIK